MIFNSSESEVRILIVGRSDYAQNYSFHFSCFNLYLFLLGKEQNCVRLA
jgi:hypothetical protein